MVVAGERCFSFSQQMFPGVSRAQARLRVRALPYCTFSFSLVPLSLWGPDTRAVTLTSTYHGSFCQRAGNGGRQSSEQLTAATEGHTLNRSRSCSREYRHTGPESSGFAVWCARSLTLYVKTNQWQTTKAKYINQWECVKKLHGRIYVQCKIV